MGKRYTIKLGGASGQGINTFGLLLSKSLRLAGYNTFSYREYPSLIKGGIASYQIDFSDNPINSSSKSCDVLTILDLDCINEYISSIKNNGLLIYDDPTTFTPDQALLIKEKSIKTIFLNTKKIAQENGGDVIMENVILLGFLWKILGLQEEQLQEVLKNTFQSKGDELVKKNLLCSSLGYQNTEYNQEYSQVEYMPQNCENNSKNMIMTGNDAIALGAIACGVRAYYGYPMTPATSIFKFLGDTYQETKILVKQAESEITAIQMVMGSMAMGTRAFTATSGGGFDLMQETISCAGMAETPLVIVLAQRIGPGTGVPTWTGSGDIHTAVNAGHGEFPKAVLFASDIPSAYRLIQESFNIAERYQLPAILLTEKHLSESLFSIQELPKDQEIVQNFNQTDVRYKVTESGISPRWKPDFEAQPYLCNSDEHNEIGESTERSEEISKMSSKRMKKLDELYSELPEPTLYGNLSANTILVGSGSVKNTILDAIQEGKNIAYLHYEYIFPLKKDLLLNLVSQGKRLILVENNQTGELGKIITQNTGYHFKETLLKFDGRPFFLEDILEIQT